MTDSKWNRKLRERLEDYSETPPEGLWEAVEAGLPERRAAAFPWWWALAGAAAALLAVVLLWTPGGNIDISVATAKAEVQEVEASPVDAVEISSVDATEISPLAALGRNDMESTEHNTYGRNDRAAADVRPATTDGISIITEENLNVTQTERNSVIQAEASTVIPAEHPDVIQKDASTVIPAERSERRDLPDTVTPDDSPVTPESSSEATDIDNVTPAPLVDPLPRRTRRAKPPVTASLIAGGLPGGTSQSFTTYGMSGMHGSAAAAAKSASVGLLSRNKATENEVRHSMPIRLGVAVNVPFSEHWSVESGLMVSNLLSSTMAISGDMKSVTDRNTVYLGIPLLAVYTPFRGERFSAYVSAGPSFEYSPFGFVTQKSYINSKQVSSERVTAASVKDVTWSLGFTAGVQWQFSRAAGLFLQPGLSWHFAGDGNVETYYTSRPVAFAVAAGIRLSF